DAAGQAGRVMARITRAASGAASSSARGCRWAGRPVPRHVRARPARCPRLERTAVLSFVGTALPFWTPAAFPLLVVWVGLGGDVMMGVHAEPEPKAYRRALRYSRLAHRLRRGAVFQLFVGSTALFVVLTRGLRLAGFLIICQPALHVFLIT